MSTTTAIYANGGERAWEGYARRLEALLTVPGTAVEIGVGEATDWHEPGTERHGLPYWFLAVRVTPASSWPQVRDRLEFLGLGPCYGESEDDVEYGKPERGLLMVGDVLVGLSQGQVRRLLKGAALADGARERTEVLWLSPRTWDALKGRQMALEIEP